MPADDFLNGETLARLVETKMPFGKYAGMLVVDLPEAYLVWFLQKGLPQGELGRMMGLALEIKTNGLAYLLTPLRSRAK